MTEMIARLYALRSHLDLVIRAAEAVVTQTVGIEPGRCPVCQADPDQQVSMDTLDGSKQRHCNACGAEWTP